MNRVFFLGVLLMIVAILFSLAALTEHTENFEKNYCVSGKDIDLSEEKRFSENREIITIEIVLKSSTPLQINVLYGNSSASFFSESGNFKINYMPDAISVSSESLIEYSCEIVARGGSPYLLLSIPALFCLLIGFPLLWIGGAALLDKSKEKIKDQSEKRSK
jgi:hypothetical protein